MITDYVLAVDKQVYYPVEDLHLFRNEYYYYQLPLFLFVNSNMNIHIKIDNKIYVSPNIS